MNNQELKVVNYGRDETISVSITIPVGCVQSRVSSNLTAGKVWPACLVLSHFLLHHRTWLQGRRIWEWGSGMAIPSLVALKGCNAQTVILQELDIKSLLDMQIEIFRANDLATSRPSFIQIPLKWGNIPSEDIGPIDLFLAADCLYERNDFADLVASAAALMDRNRGAHWIMCYQDRNLLYSIDELFEYWGLKAELITFQSFNFDPRRIEINQTLVDDFPTPETCPTTLFLLEICQKDEAFIFC